MLKVASGMLAISQGTLMKLLEISKKRLFAVCLAVCMVMFHLTHQKKEKKLAKLRDLCIYLLYGRQWSNMFYFVSVNMTKLSLVYLRIIKTCCPCPYFNAWKPSSAVISICTHTVNFMECNGWQWREIHGWHPFILFFDRTLKAASVTYSMWKIAVNLTWLTISRLYDLCQFLYPPNHISIY